MAVPGNGLSVQDQFNQGELMHMRNYSIGAGDNDILLTPNGVTTPRMENITFLTGVLMAYGEVVIGPPYYPATRRVQTPVDMSELLHETYGVYVRRAAKRRTTALAVI